MRAHHLVREVAYTHVQSPQAAKERIRTDKYIPDQVRAIALENFEAFLPHPHWVHQHAVIALTNPDATEDDYRGALEWAKLAVKIAPDDEEYHETIAELQNRLQPTSNP